MYSQNTLPLYSGFGEQCVRNMAVDVSVTVHEMRKSSPLSARLSKLMQQLFTASTLVRDSDDRELLVVLACLAQQLHRYHLTTL
jgi:hypothetical protein